ncbi:hypothetical protein GYMLUDRAFT_49719 [Collybiopsis luxurians FD-317 M1]|uniref:Uncharacterized protein n=1 Tax=Collybiopsis luxurians FD-317 M1 TaxID=944289 RepID=A0A0D0AR80_9AGAR|nr:hypothetical protein GYMLUDRAFT_49719 [Collybiopsis luxurians FD-317 M1]
MLGLLMNMLTLPLAEHLSLTTAGSAVCAERFPGPNPQKQYQRWTRNPAHNVSDIPFFICQWPRMAFNSFLGRSRCSLTTLELKAMPIPDCDTIALLDLLPELRKLVIHELPWAWNSGRFCATITGHHLLRCLNASTQSDSFTSTLTPVARWSSWSSSNEKFHGPLVPKLKHLELGIWPAEVQLGYEPEVLLKMVQSRWIPDAARRAEIGVECLEFFKLKIATGWLSDETRQGLEYLRQAGLVVHVLEEKEDEDYFAEDDNGSVESAEV